MMPNGQLRFALYDLDGHLKPGATPELTMAGKPAKCMWCHEAHIRPAFTDFPRVNGHFDRHEFDALIYAAPARAAVRTATPWTRRSITAMPATTPIAELLYLTFEEPSRERLAREWGVSVERAAEMLRGKPTHAHPEFRFLGDELYERADVDGLAPYPVLATPRSVRDVDGPEPDIIGARIVTPPLDVSVVMPTWNRARFLRAAIDSVLAQTVTIRELIIADDGSNAPTRALLEEYAARPGIRVLWRDRCGNPAAVRNAAIREASGRYVAFADSDDVWHADKLERQAAALHARTGLPLVLHLLVLHRYAGSADSGARRHPAAVHAPRWSMRSQDSAPRWRCRRCSRSGRCCWRRVCSRRTFVPTKTTICGCGLRHVSDAARLHEPLVKVRRHDEHFSRDEPYAALKARDFYLARAARLVHTPAVRAQLRRMRVSNTARLWKMSARRIVARWW